MRPPEDRDELFRWAAHVRAEAIDLRRTAGEACDRSRLVCARSRAIETELQRDREREVVRA